MATKQYDLVIIGAGSGNMLITDEFDQWRVAVVDADRFGGTCLNRGCIPSKMLVYSADVAQAVRHADRYGVRATLDGADWPAIRERVFGRIDPIHDSAVRYRRENGIDVYLERAHFVGPKRLQVGEDVLESERFVLAAGARPFIPPISGLDGVDYYTSDNLMRIESLPASLAVVGGGFIAAEMSHVFGSLGSSVTVIERGEHLLARHDHDIRERFTREFRSRFDVRLNTQVERVEGIESGVRLHLVDDAGHQSLDVEALLVATGRRPNSDLLDVGAAGVEMDVHGHVRTDATYQTNVPGIWAFGDLANHFQLKHMANIESRIVGHNLLHPEDPRRAEFSVVPSAVFADPQVASVGVTEEDLRELSRDYVTATRSYGDTAYGWALEDTSSFVKVLADPVTRLVLGAHLIGPQASTLIQPLIQAMCLGNTVDQLARDVIYIHPALTEVVEQVLLAL
jgi:mycothione reductase